MLGTLERRSEIIEDRRSAPPVPAVVRLVRTDRPSRPALVLVAHLDEVQAERRELPRLVPAVPARGASSQSPVVERPPIRGAAVDRPVRLTLRARRLLAGLALLCCAGFGTVAVDLLASLTPEGPVTYAAQQAPYAGAGDSAGSSSGLVMSSAETITVQPGDTLWMVAERFDPSADPRAVIAAIMSLNDLDSPILQPGQTLRLP